jgi:hypothetical protein
VGWPEARGKRKGSGVVAAAGYGNLERARMLKTRLAAPLHALSEGLDVFILQLVPV